MQLEFAPPSTFRQLRPPYATPVSVLTVGDVLAIHDLLVADFAGADDPISPSGVRSMHLLESAVARQFAGFHDRPKYGTAVENASALTYGLCLNHPFHNGNKRTSLVSLLCHLDRNDLTFADDVSQEALYDFMLSIASRRLAAGKSGIDWSDSEVVAMTPWIRKRTRKVEKGERVVTFRELKSILSSHGFSLEDPKGNTIEIVRYEQRSSWLGLRRSQYRRHIMRMGNPGGGEVVGKAHLREIRERCELTENDGIDSHTFYTKSRPVDYFVGEYRRTLRRLARV
jgi:death on curing protein